jgi:predicted deacylase
MPRPTPSPPPGAGLAAALLLPALLAAPPLAAQPRAAQPRAAADAPFRVGPLQVRAGEAATGALVVPAGVDSGTQVPVSVVRGRQPGPVLALIAGTHGSEVAPVVALQRVRARLDPAALRGTVILVHVANLPSFQARTVYYSPVDGKNLNRVYPGRPDGTVSERIAHAITTEVIDRADYLVDLHAGDGNESLRPYTYWSRLGLDPKVDSAARETGAGVGRRPHRGRRRPPARPGPHALHAEHRPGARQAVDHHRDRLARRPRPRDGAPQRGGRLPPPAPPRHAPGAAERVARPVWLVRTSVLTSPATGTWHAAVERGHTVAEGTVVGTVTDFAGRPLAEVRAPFAGRCCT